MTDRAIIISDGRTSLILLKNIKIEIGKFCSSLSF